MSFNILEHIEKLEPAGKANRYLCPACGGNDLTLSPDGAYTCWHGCDCSEIRNSIAPLEEKSCRPQAGPSKPTKKKKANPPAVVNSTPVLATLSAPATDAPEFEALPDGTLRKVYNYGPGLCKIRLQWTDQSKPKGYDKRFTWHHLAPGGSWAKGAGNHKCQPYQMDQALQVLKQSKGNVLLKVEGEDCTDAARSIGLAAVTLSRHSKDEYEGLAQIAKENGFAIADLYDNDAPGRSKAKALEKACDRSGVPYLGIDPTAIHSDLVEGGDIQEILEAIGSEQFIQRLVAEVERVTEEKRQEAKLNDPDERLRLEIQALLKESDPIRRLRLRGEICSSYRISSKDLAELLKHLERAQSTPKQHVFSAGEFLAQESEALSWLVPGLLPVGETLLLAAQAKAGKTNLATDVLYAVLSGGQILGERAKRGKALFISTDESANTTRRRLRQRGIDLIDGWENNLRLMTHLDINDLSTLEAELESFRPQLVVIDSLTSICLDIGVSEKDPEFARYIYRLKQVLSRYGSSCLLIHHENKDEFAKGINQIAGSARIPAATWGIWQLKAVDPNNENDPRRMLKIKPREGESTTLNLEMNPRAVWSDRGIFEFHGELGDETGQKRTQADRVLSLLKSYAPRGLEYEEINNHLQIGKGLYTVLDRLEDRGIVTKRRSAANPRRWVYALPNEFSLEKEDVPVMCHLEGGDSPPPSVDRDEVVESTKTIANKGFEVSQQLVNNYSTTIQQTDLWNEVLNSQNVDTKDDSAVSQQIPYSGGESVPFQSGTYPNVTVEAADPPVIVEVIRELPTSKFNPATRRLESQHQVRLIDGTTAIAFESDLPVNLEDMIISHKGCA